MRASTTRRNFVALGMTAALGALLPFPADAHGTWRVGDIEIREVWARSAMKGRNGAAYLEIINHGDEPDRLVAASSPTAGRVELHTHVMAEGVMKMRPVEAIDIPAGGTVLLKPGGFHIMLMRLQERLAPDMHIPLTLIFARAGRVEVVAHVRPAGAMSGMMGDHEHEHHGGEEGRARGD